MHKVNFMREMFLSIRPKLLAKTKKADMKKLMPFLLLFCYLHTAFAADDVVNTRTENTIVQNTTSLFSSVDSAKDWNLTEDEWASYLALMRGSAGYYYSQLTPPENIRPLCERCSGNASFCRNTR